MAFLTWIRQTGSFLKTPLLIVGLLIWVGFDSYRIFLWMDHPEWHLPVWAPLSLICAVVYVAVHFAAYRLNENPQNHIRTHL